MLIGGILLGLIAGLLAGGSLSNLASIRLRWIVLLFLAVIVRFATEAAIEANIQVAKDFRLPLFGASFGLLLMGLWVNRSHPGMSLAFIGILLNTTAILSNSGFMPIWRPSFIAAGFDPATELSPFHTMLANDALTADFLLHAGPLGDILPIPIPAIRNVASIGDLFLTAGLGFFLFATVLRSRAEAVAEDARSQERRLGPAEVDVLGRRIRATDLGRRVRLSSGLASEFTDASALDGRSSWAGPVRACRRASRLPRQAPRHRRSMARSPSPGPAPRSWSGSTGTHSSGSPSTARSRPSGSAS